jgi:hyaluronan synthase
VRRLASLLVLAAVAALLAAIDRPALTLTGKVLVACIGAKILLSFVYRSKEPLTSRQAKILEYKRLTLVLPFYNEDAALLRECLDGIARQTRPPDRLHIVNDGSPKGADIINDALPRLRELMDVEYTVFPENRGKREALAHAFAHAETDIFMTTDSDTVLDPKAIEEGLKPFKDPKVTAVTGRVGAINRKRNILTLFTDFRYAGSFLHERAALSMFGSVLVCCGAIAFYRADAIKPHLSDFLSQRFMGQRVLFGVDRRLTNYALLNGRVVVQPGAIAYTAVPQTLNHYVRQQVRWTRSFLQESVWIIQTFPIFHRAFWMNIFDFASWVIYTSLVVIFAVLQPWHIIGAFLTSYFAFSAVVGYARSARYLEIRNDQHFMSQVAILLLSPIYGITHSIIFTPLRLYSLATLKHMRWNTRKDVEVALHSESERSVRVTAGVGVR